MANKVGSAIDIEIDTPEKYTYKGKFHWSEVPGELYSAGMRLMTLNNFMLRKDGYTKRLLNKPKEAYFDVVFDKEFVYNRLAESLESLGILDPSGMFDESLYDLLTTDLKKYCASASDRAREKSLRHQAEQMAAIVTTRTVDEWYEFLKAESAKTTTTEVATPASKTNSKKQSTTTTPATAT